MRLSALLAPIALVSVSLLCSCAQFSNQSISNLTAADIARLQGREALPPQRPVQIQTSFNDGSEILAAPSVVARSGQTAAIEIASDLSYPTRFTLAQTIPEAAAGDGDGSSFPITPAQPAQMAQASTGLSMECTPKIVGPFIEITGTIIFRWQEDNSNTTAIGEGIGTITTNDGRVVLTDNRHELPVFGSRSTPFFVRALPGETYTLTVRGEHRPITIDLTASLMEPDRGELASLGRKRYLVAAR